MSQDVADSSIVWAPCGDALPLNVNTAIALTASAGSCAGSLTGTDGFGLKLKWRKC